MKVHADTEQLQSTENRCDGACELVRDAHSFWLPDRAARQCVIPRDDYGRLRLAVRVESSDFFKRGTTYCPR